MRNRALCKKCDTIIESKYCHDFVRCKCGQAFVDGGDCYMRWGAEDPSMLVALDDEGKEGSSLAKDLECSKIKAT